MRQEKENHFTMQKNFTTLHVFLLSVLLIYLLELYAQTTNMQYLWAVIVFVPLVAVDVLLKSKGYLKSILVIQCLRFVQIAAASYFVISAGYVYDLGIATLILLLLDAEFLILYDLTDMYYKVCSIVISALPLMLFILLNRIFNNTKNDNIFALGFYCIMIYGTVIYGANMYTKTRKFYDEEVFAQTRALSNANAMYEDLKASQEKVKRANEQLGLQKIRLEAAYNKINSINAEMMIQNEIVTYISSSLEIGKLMTLITESILEEIGVDICAILLKSGVVNNKKVKYKIRTRLSPKFNQEFSRAIESDCFAEYLCCQKTYVDNYVNKSNYPKIPLDGLKSLLIVPLTTEEEQIGALLVGHLEENYFSENTLFFEAIVSQLLIALKNANMYQEMQNMAILDGLTGIFNRGHLTELFNEYLNESVRNTTPFTAALFDIDKFKNVNDSYGHLFGDVVIKTIASLAHETADNNDGIVGRYGGEEFVIMFPNRSLDEAYPLVDALHKKIKETELSHNGEIVHVSVSVGITCYPETCKVPEDLLNRADWAMYYSKQHGRDRITIDSDSIREEVMLK